jgi:hypothetical protein
MLIERGVRMGLELGQQGRILLTRDTGSGTSDGRPRHAPGRTTALEVAVHRGQVHPEGVGHVRGKQAAIDGLHNLEAEVGGIGVHSIVYPIRIPLEKGSRSQSSAASSLLTE